MKTILDLKLNQKAIIKKISIAAGKDFINDIMDHGVFPGTLIMISDLSISNDKVIFFSGENLLSIRKSEAMHILVDEIDE
jgi:Fe2+ transport system protein FeoA